MNFSCPSCFLKIAPKGFALMCVSGRCAPTEDPHGSSFYGSAQTMTTLGRRDEKGNPLPCPKCNQNQFIDICPRCHERLPAHQRHTPVFTMSLAGARGAGKTVYITALVETLRRYVSAKGGVLQPIGNTASAYRDGYYDVLFRQGRALPATTAGRREPLLWRIDIAGRNSVDVVMRDVAGEDLEQVDRRGPQPWLTFLGDADLTVFLFDPYAVPRIMDSLHGLIPRRNAAAVGRPADEVLNNVLAMLGNQSRLALTISKFDVIQRVAAVAGRPDAARIMRNMGAAFNRDETMRPPLRYSESDSRELDSEVRALLDYFGGTEVVRRAAVSAGNGRIRTMRTFAVSALGAAPGDNVLDEHGISSFRCLDPLLWGMNEVGLSV